MEQDFETQLTELIRTELVTKDLELYSLRIFRTGSRTTVSLAIDHPYGGVTLAECAKWNQWVGNLIDERSMIESSYVVEVASPGVDWPLQTERDFRRLVGKKVWLQYRDGETVKTDSRKLKRVEDGKIILEDLQRPGGLEVPLASIVSAKPGILMS